MDKIDFVLKEEFLNKLFPFYLLINSDCEIVSVGKSINKILNIQIGMKFQNVFEIRRPYTEIHSFEDLFKLQNQLTFFECKNDTSVNLRGQFEYIADEHKFIFVGSPWFYSMDQVREKKLTLSDFAIHDPLIDLLHILKTAEMASDDLKHLVKTIDQQKKNLKEANKAIEDIALFPKQNPDPLIRIDLEGNILALNPSAEKLDFLEYKSEILSMQVLWKVIIKDLIFDQNKSTVEANYEDRTFSFVVVKLEEHGYYNIYGRDISNQKKYEEDLLKLSLVAESTTNGVIIADENGLTEWVNHAFLSTTGYTLEEMKGKKPGEVLQGKDTDPKTIQLISENLKKEISFQCEILNYNKNGIPYWIKMNFQPIKNKHGKLIQYFAIEEDITEQKRSQEKLTRREEKYRSIISNMNLGLLEVDLNETILMANQSLCNMSGYKEEELIGKKTYNIFLDDSSKVIIEEKRDLRANKISDAYEICLKNKAGETRYWLISGAPLFNDNGELIGSIGIHLDITDRKEQEQKMEVLLGTLQSVNQELNDFAYIVSHDLKAPLRAIGSLATWLQADYSDKLDEEGKQTLGLLVQRTQRMHNMIEGILNYSKLGRHAEQKELIHTTELVHKVIDLLSPPSSIHIQILSHLPDVYYEEVKLQQIFQNLLSNAIKFMDKPIGLITIESVDEGKYIKFKISDNGPGIEKNYFEKIFQIFQTLKSRDEFESTGIGLSIVKKIVENFGGTISVESNINIGTTFTFSVLKV